MSRQRIKHWRVVMGSILMAAPFIFMAAFFPLAIAIGSLGMDVHWSASRFSLYAAECVAALSAVAVILSGAWLYRTGMNGNDT